MPARRGEPTLPEKRFPLNARQLKGIVEFSQLGLGLLLQIDVLEGDRHPRDEIGYILGLRRGLIIIIGGKPRSSHLSTLHLAWR